jgi:hypothetical protein
VVAGRSACSGEVYINSRRAAERILKSFPKTGCKLDRDRQNLSR